MTIDQLRRAIEARPFKPFVIHMNDGREFEVNHPKLIGFFRGMERRVTLAFPSEEAFEMIDLLHVSSLTNGGSRRRKAG